MGPGVLPGVIWITPDGPKRSPGAVSSAAAVLSPFVNIGPVSGPRKLRLGRVDRPGVDITVVVGILGGAGGVRRASSLSRTDGLAIVPRCSASRGTASATASRDCTRAHVS